MVSCSTSTSSSTTRMVSVPSGTLTLGGRARSLEADTPIALTLPAGAHAFLLQSKGVLLAGGLEVSGRGGVMLSLQPDVKPPIVQLTWQVPQMGSAPPPSGDPEQ